MSVPFHRLFRGRAGRCLAIPLWWLPQMAGSAPITWGAAANTTSKSQLIEGQVIVAISGGTGAAITGGGAGGTSSYPFTGVNYTNLIFTPTPAAGILADSSNGAPSTGDSNFDTVLKSLTFANANIASGTQTISGLTSGSQYRIQVFFNDQRAGLTTRVMTFGDGGTPGQNVNLTAGGSGWGQHAAGIFTASGTTQTLTHAANGFANVHFNAILVTEVGSPPPAAPAIPVNLTVNSGNQENALNWDDNGQPGFLGFRVGRSTTAGGPYTRIATTAVSSFTDSTALNGTTYYYVVTTVNIADEESAPSAERSGTPSASAAPTSPNFLFIITDDQDTYSVGAYRRSEPVEPTSGGMPYTVDTPNIDRLAAEGMLFHQARLMGGNSGAVCTPSRTCLMTGKNTWEREVGVTAAVTLPGIFNRGVRTGTTALPFATYRTCKQGNSYPTANAEFTMVNDAGKTGNTDGNGSEWHADRAIEYLNHWNTNHRPNRKPFLMHLGFSHPHDTRNARETPNLTGRYGCINTTTPAALILNPIAPPLPLNHLSCTPATYPAHPFDHGDLDVRDEISVSGVGQYRTGAVIRNEIGRQYACVDWIDRQAGRVLAKLEDPDGNGDKSDSVIHNTYIIFTTDHGISIGRHGLLGKQNLYEHTWRVPYIVRGPGIAPGTETNALIYLHDTFATLCDLAGLDLPPTIDANDGRSFRNVLANPAATAREVLYGAYAGGDKPGIRAVTEGRFKLIKYDVAANATQVTQLFDLQTNPFELLPEHGVTNLATHPAYRRLRARLEERMMAERRFNADPYQFLGDRTLLRFEEGPAGSAATLLRDRFAWTNHGTANGAFFAAEVPYGIDRINGEPNTLSLRLTPGSSVPIPTNRALSMGPEPFTLEAYVKLATPPTSSNTIPVIAKGTDYQFYAGGGGLGNPAGGLSLRLAGTTIHSTLAITDSNWHYLGVAFNSVTGTVRFALDDQIQILSTTAVGIAGPDPVVLAGGAFDGLLDEVSITAGFLAEAELQPINPSPPGPFRITGWNFDAPSVISLTFESRDDLLYTVQRSPTPAPSGWIDVRSSVPGTPGATSTTISDLPRQAGTRSEFYRIVAR